MTVSAELMRFLDDHAMAESRAAFASGVGPGATAATLAAAFNAKGYRIREADVVAALESRNQSALADEKLDGVVGGQGLDGLDARMGNDAEKFKQKMMESMVSDMLKQDARAMDRMKQIRRESGES